MRTNPLKDVLSVRMGAFAACFTALATYLGGWPAVVVAIVVAYFLSRV